MSNVSNDTFGYANSWSMGASREILQSVRENGLMPPDMLQKQGIQHFGSVDDGVASYICVNAFPYETVVNRKNEVLGYLLNNPAAGIYPLSLERRTDITHAVQTFDKPITECVEIATQRVHNTALIVLDENYIQEHEKEAGIQSLFQASQIQTRGGENSLESAIPSHAFKRILAPSHLADLFREMFPQCSIQEIPSKSLNLEQTITSESWEALQQAGKSPKKLGFDFLNSRTLQDCQAPAYKEALSDYVDELVQANAQKPLFVHLLRLRAPSDQQFEITN